MYEIDYYIVVLLVIFNIIPAFFLYKKLRVGIKQIYFIFSIISIFLFSGVGISYKHIDDRFLLQYLIFSVLYIITLYIVLKYDFRKLKTKNKAIDEKHHSLSSYISSRGNNIKYSWFFNIATAMYLLTFIVFLLVPVMRIQHLWNPPASSLLGIFDTREMFQSNIILNNAQTLRTFLFPFFMIRLYILKSQGKTIKGILLITVWIYLDYLSVLYMGRYMMVVYVLFLFFYIIADSECNINLKKKHFIMILVGFFISLPLFAAYQFSRLGTSIGKIDLLESINILSSEAMFPMYYNTATKISEFVSPISYYLWFLVLPIPFITNKHEISALINRVFSEYVLGVKYASSGYYVLLPSLFGEALIIYNEYFYWIHAIFLAFVIGNLCKLVIKNKELGILNIYFAVNIFWLARGGSQSYLGNYINSLIIYILIKYLLKRINKHKI